MRTLQITLILILNLLIINTSWTQIYHQDSYTISCEYTDQSLSYDSETGLHHFHGTDGESPKFKIQDCWHSLDIDADVCYLEPDKYFPAIVDGKYGVMNMVGEILIPFKYEALKYDYGDTYYISSKGKWYKTKGKGKKKIKGDVLGFIEEYAIIQRSDKSIYFLHEHGSTTASLEDEVPEELFTYTDIDGCKKGLITNDGHISSDAVYDDVYVISSYAIVVKDQKYGLVDNEGFVIECQYDDLNDYCEHGILQYKIDGKYGLFDPHNGSKITEPIYDDIYCGDEAIKVKIGDKYGFIDYEGNIIAKPIYDGVMSFQNELAAVEKDGLWGFVNIENELIIDFQFTICKGTYGMYFRKQNEASVCLNGECIIIDSTGEKIRSCE